MHTANSILIRAPKACIFETAANLELWPAILPHYRYVTFIDKGPERSVVKMAATRSGIPISWTSELEVDRTAWQIRFHHLCAFTKGMRVVWTFDETSDGVLVRILHDLQFRIPALAPLADLIVGGFFIDYVANKTLATFKAHLESVPAVAAAE